MRRIAIQCVFGLAMLGVPLNNSDYKGLGVWDQFRLVQSLLSVPLEEEDEASLDMWE